MGQQGLRRAIRGKSSRSGQPCPTNHMSGLACTHRLGYAILLINRCIKICTHHTSVI
uniref:Uncharacterized protein n=1 Tax=Arundo donax TaxID=35708 RepID=A0A0A9CXG5_ARUDO